MKRYLRENVQFLLIMLIWLISGRYGGPLIYLVLPATVFLFKRKKMMAELLISFFFILILSDSRQPGMEFAQSVKDIYVVLLGLFFFLDTEEYMPINKLFYRFIPFFLVAIFCLFFTENLFTAFQKTLSYFFVLVVVTNMTLTLIRKDAEDFLRKLICFITLMLIAGLVLRYVSPGVVILEARYTGILGNPNGLGVFCFLFFAIYSVVIRYYPMLFTRSEKWVITGSIIVSLLLCGSRSAIFSVLLFVGFNYFYRISAFLGFIVFLLALLVYQYISSNLVSIVTSLGLETYFRIDTLEDGSGRLIAWEFAWQKIQDNMFIGKGFSYTEYLYKKFYTFLSQEGHQGNAHNSFLTFWLDTGLIGLVLYLAAFLFSFARAARQSSMAIPSLYAILFSANFESWLTGSLNPLTIQVWILLTLLTHLPEVSSGASAVSNEENLLQHAPA